MKQPGFTTKSWWPINLEPTECRRTPNGVLLSIWEPQEAIWVWGSPSNTLPQKQDTSGWLRTVIRVWGRWWLTNHIHKRIVPVLNWKRENYTKSDVKSEKSGLKQKQDSPRKGRSPVPIVSVSDTLDIPLQLRQGSHTRSRQLMVWDGPKTCDAIGRLTQGQGIPKLWYRATKWWATSSDPCVSKGETGKSRDSPSDHWLIRTLSSGKREPCELSMPRLGFKQPSEPNLMLFN
jgi:hypothetical protein